MLAWAPLPLGSARPWAWDILGLAAMLLLALSAFEEMSKSSRSGLLLKPLVPALVMGGLVAAWIVFQSLPWDVLGWHHPLWDRGGEVLGRKLAASLSIDREQSMIHLFRLMTYAAYFFIAWQAARRGEGAEAILRAIAAISAVYAIYGLIEFVSPEPRILWLVKDTYIGDVTSTFVNRNSYATFAGLGVLANLVLVANVLIKNTDVTSRASLWLSLIDSLLGRARWWILGLVLVSGSLLMSHSRAGLAATLSAVLAFTALVLMAPSARAPWRFWFGAFVAAGSVAILVLTGASTLDRLDMTSIDGELRPKINEVLLRAIHDNFLSGTGLGSFPDIFPLYQPLSIPGLVDLAHNDYLENLLELGVPAALMLFATVLYLAGRCVLGVFRRRRDMIYPCAGVAATILIGVHSIFDFSMQIPAVAVTFAVILGVGVAQSVNSRDAA
jgi:O-antigen ligase